MIIIYDGQCSFCTKTVSFLKKKKQKNAELELYDSRQRAAREILHEHQIRFINFNTIYCIEKGKVFTKSRAVFTILKITSFPFRLLTFFEILPVALTDKIYDIVAKNRYRISKLF